MIRVLVIDDHPVVRAGIARLVDTAEDITVVGTGADGAAAIALDASLEPDVVLMDLSMPGTGGVEATRAIVAARPEAVVVVITSSADHDAILGAIDAGAVGYLLKESEAEVLVEGVRAAARGESPLDPKASRALIRARQDRTVARLSDRELQILRLVADGLLNKQIARSLGIGEKTVKAHLTRIFGRIGVDNRAQAVAWAHLHGGLEAPAPSGAAGGSYDQSDGSDAAGRRGEGTDSGG